jgi:hypothetical protein
MPVHTPNSCGWRAIMIRVAEMLQACNFEGNILKCSTDCVKCRQCEHLHVYIGTPRYSVCGLVRTLFDHLSNWLTTLSVKFFQLIRLH